MTRQHLNLTKEQIANLGGDWDDKEGVEGENRPHSQVEIRRRWEIREDLGVVVFSHHEVYFVQGWCLIINELLAFFFHILLRKS